MEEEWTICPDDAGRWAAPNVYLIKCCNHTLVMYNGADGHEQDTVHCSICDTIWRMHTTTHLEKRPAKKHYLDDNE
jgi:hypothetical protein